MILCDLCQLESATDEVLLSDSRVLCCDRCWEEKLKDKAPECPSPKAAAQAELLRTAKELLATFNGAPTNFGQHVALNELYDSVKAIDPSYEPWEGYRERL